MSVLNPSRILFKYKPGKPTRLQQETRVGLLFLGPWLIGFVLLKALPILAALVFSLTDFRMLTPYVGRVGNSFFVYNRFLLHPN